MVLGLVLIAPLPGLWLLGPIAQDQSYHLFADQRVVLGIPHAGDVISNLALVLVGIAGVVYRRRLFVLTRAERLAPLALFAAVALTGVGSAWYHWAPDDARLVWDRLPLALAMASLCSLLLAERLGARAGARALGPLLLLGVAGVGWWAYDADLRLYALLQIYPVLLIVLLPLWRRSRYERSGEWWGVLLAFLAARTCEVADRAVYAALGLVSGHTLKHLLAALAAALLLRMLLRRGAATQAARMQVPRR